RRKFLTLSALTVGGIAAASACGSGSGGGGESAGGELRVAQFGSAHRMGLFEQVFEAYTAKNPDWSLTLDAASNDAYLDKLATQVSGGNAPAVMGLFHSAVAQFARQNALVELDEYLGNGLDTSKFTEGLVDLG